MVKLWLLFFAAAIAGNALPLDGGADIVASQSRNLLYISQTANKRLVVVDPKAASVAQFIPLAGEPTRMTISTDEQFLYVYLRDQRAVVRVSLATAVVDQQFPVQVNQDLRALVAVPGAPNSVAIVADGVGIYDAGVIRGTFLPLPGVLDFVFGEDGARGYALRGPPSLIDVLKIDASGTAISNSLGSISIADGSLAYAGGLLFVPDSTVRDASTGRVAGLLLMPGTGSALQMVASDRENLVIALSFGGMLSLYDTAHFLSKGYVNIPRAVRFARYGATSLAVLTPDELQLIDFSVFKGNGNCIGTPTRDTNGILHLRTQTGVGALIYHAATDSLYLTTIGGACADGNSLFKIDSKTLAPGAPVFLGSEPSAMSATSDGAHLFVSLRGSSSLARVDTRKLAVERTIPVATSFQYGSPAYIAALGSSPTSFAAATYNGSQWSLTIFDDATPRPATYKSTYPGPIAASADGSTVYQLAGSSVLRVPVRSDGVSAADTLISYIEFAYSLNLDGDTLAVGPSLFQASTGRAMASINGSYLVAPDLKNGRVFGVNSTSLSIYDAKTWRRVKELAPSVFWAGARKMLAIDSDHLLVQTNDELLLIPISTFVPILDQIEDRVSVAGPGLRKMRLPAKDIAYNRRLKSLVATTGSDLGPRGNSLVAVDPVSGAITSVTPIGSEPFHATVSDSGEFTYIQVLGERAVKRVEDNLVIDVLASAPVAIQPGNPRTIAVATPQSELILFDDAVARPARIWPTPQFFSSLALHPDGNKLYAGQYSYEVNAGGLGAQQFLPELPYQYTQSGGRILENSGGRVYGAEKADLTGAIEWGPKVYSAAENRIYVAVGATVYAYDPATLTRVARYEADDGPMNITRLLECEPGTLAMLDSRGSLYFLDTSVIAPFSPATDAPQPVVTGDSVSLALPSNGVVFHAASGMLYASVPVSASAMTNTIATIDPQSGTVTGFLSVGSGPNALALPGDTLFVGLDGPASVARVSLADGSSSGRRVRKDASLLYADQLAASADGKTLVASLLSAPAAGGTGYTVQRRGWQVYRDEPSFFGAIAENSKNPVKAIPIPIPPVPPPVYVAFGADASTFYSYDSVSGGYRVFEGTIAADLTVSTRTVVARTAYPGSLVFREGMLYSSSGLILNTRTGETTSTAAFSGGSDPGVVAISEDGTTAYHARRLDQRVGVWLQVIDLASGAVLSERQLSTAYVPPFGVALYPGGVAVSSLGGMYLIPR